MKGFSPRLQNMREETIKTPQEISLVRARAFTEAIRGNPGMPRIQQSMSQEGQRPRRL